MKKIPVQEAVGSALCHDITAVREGFKGRAFARGHVITPEDIDVLLDLGKRQIFVWEEGKNEVHEEEAAILLGQMSKAKGISISKPSEGKITLIAEHDGQMRINKNLLHRLNAIEDITITSLPDHYPVVKGQKVAGLRIVPLVTKEENLILAQKVCDEDGGSLFEIKKYRQLKAAIIVTGSEVYHGRIKDRFEPVIRKKLGKFSCEILGCTVCDDNLEMLEGAIESYKKAEAKLIILTGGMSVDPDDLTPTAIRRQSQKVITQGIPVQPGNMFMLAYDEDVVLLGVPGAAIHHEVTALDIVLPQVFTGERFTKKDFLAMAEGGACQDCPQCHYPVCTYGRY